MKLRIPIWIKLFLMTIFILLLAMIPTAYSNYARIKTESVDREWQIVSQQAESRAQETQLVLAHLLEKSQFLATQLLTFQLKKEIPSAKDLSIFTGVGFRSCTIRADGILLYNCRNFFQRCHIFFERSSLLCG